MMPFDALEVMGRERREALIAQAENHRSSRAARLRARKGRVAKLSSLARSIRAPRLGPRPAAADWDLPVARQERRAV